MARLGGVLMVAGFIVARGATAADLPRALVEPYLQVQVALAGDQMTGLSAHADAIGAAAATLGKDAETIVAAAKKLGAARDLTGARAAFGEVSTALVAYAKKTNSGFGPDVRLAYCPMAGKDWLQEGTDLRNPYYGAAMLSCGSFKK